jgi:hypothetical protein
VDTEELEAVDPLHYSPIDLDRGIFGPPFPVVHDKLTLMERLFSWHHTARSLTSSLIGCLIIIGDQANQCWVVRNDDGNGVVLGHLMAM